MRIARSAAVVASLCAFTAVARGAAPRVDGPYVSGDLAVYLVRGPSPTGAHRYLTLTDGLADGSVVVHEVRQVNQLEVENKSDRDLFLQAGEIVKGGQQDRTLARDLVVPAHGPRVSIDAHCVEHGRWQQRGTEVVTQFKSSDQMLATKALRRANYAGDQSAVWANVTIAQQQAAGGVTGGRGYAADAATRPASPPQATASPTSLQLTLEDKGLQDRAHGLIDGLPAAGSADSADVVGFAFAVRGKLDGGDVYASHATFAKLYPKLLMAAALEATIDGSAGQATAPPSAADVATLMAAADAAKSTPVATNARVRMLVQTRTGRTMANAAGPSTSPSINVAAVQQTQRQLTGQIAPAEPTPPPAPQRAVVVTRSTDRMDEYETTDTAVPAEPFVHRAYLTK